MHRDLAPKGRGFFMKMINSLKIKAKEYIASGDYLKAENLYLKIIENDTNDIEAINALANTYFFLNKYDESEIYLKKLLLISNVKNKDDIYSKLGDLAIAKNLIDVAIKFYSRSLKINKNNFGSLVNSSVCYMRLNRFEEAISGFNIAKNLNTKNLAIHINSGICNYHLGNYKNSIIDIENALKLNIDYPVAYFHLGNNYLSLNLYDLAEINYKKSIKLDPKLLKSYINLGVIYQKTNRNELAIDIFTEAIELDNKSYIAYNNRGSSYKEIGRYNEAISDYLVSIELNKNYYEPLSNIAITYLDVNELFLALSFIEKALIVKPGLAKGLFNKGLILNQMGDKYSALKLFLELVNNNEADAETFNLIGLVLTELGHNKKAKEYHNRALELEPKSLKFNWDAAFAEIPVIVGKDDVLDNILTNFSKKLSILEAIIKDKNENDYEKIVGRTQPYYLAYLNTDNKEVLMQYGKICRSIMSKYDNKITNTKLKDEKLRFGIVSAHIRYHSVWNSFLKGIVTALNKKNIDLYIYYIDSKYDVETEVAKLNSFKFEYGVKILQDWIEIVKTDQLDVILYPEIGMNQKALQLASIRLAKTQMTSWGHPQTSGLDSIDYFLSSDFAENLSSQQAYSEKLIKLPGLGFYFEPPSLNIEEKDFNELGLKLESNIILCLGLPNKFHIENDWIYIELVRNIKNIQLVFMKDATGGYQVLESRLKLAFFESKIRYENNVVFLPYLSRDGFNSLMRRAKVYIDTVYFSSLNTTLQSLGNILPVVTLTGDFLRNNTSSGILKAMELYELIAVSKENYINIISKLISDSDYYLRIKKIIFQNLKLIYKDTSPILALENFLINLRNK